MSINPKAFEYALQQIDNGFIFEHFAAAFLSQTDGTEFIPIGGIKDRGIDGLEHTFSPRGIVRNIYQASIEKVPSAKIQGTMTKLIANGIEFSHLYYVTNQIVEKQDDLIDTMFDLHKKVLHIRDLKWFSARANSDQGTINAFRTFIQSHLHEFATPGKSYIVGNLIDDPRVFVYLRQQWDHDRAAEKVDVIVADGLILFALEDTDPDKGLFRNRDEIRRLIEAKIKFDPKTLHQTIDKRLAVLSAKPRKIKHHKDIDAYCLPYETRQQICERNLEDAQLHREFQSQCSAMLEKHLMESGVRVRDCLALMEKTLNQIYYQQGLEFADFVLKGENQDAFEKDLSGTVGRVVDDSPVVDKNKELVKSAVLMTIREVVYNGTREQKLFLQKLSNTYMMLFLLQCDPKLGTYFHSLASKLNVYVCTSIIIPAMSEYLLEPENRRHWNLLKGARDAGVRLIINETILSELVSHFKRIIAKYAEFYKYDEELYAGNELQTLYIDEIMIRAYFYGKLRGKVTDFYDYVDNFVSPELRNAGTELTAWLHEEFGIELMSDKSLGVTICKKEEESLTHELKRLKSAAPKAVNDARVILTLYAIREKNNEAGAADIFGYRTWWLSKDTTTMKAVNQVFKDKYRISCYMRPDFLYNYISLAPRSAEIKEAYDTMFPSLLGVNISYHLPPDIVHCVHECMKEHQGKNAARRGAILQSLTDRLRSDLTSRNRAFVQHFLDGELKRLETEFTVLPESKDYSR